MKEGNTESELFSFAARVLEHYGAITETTADRLHALLPDELAKFLETSEEIQLGDGGEKLLYGSPILDRLITLGTQDVPVAYGKLIIPYLKKGGFERLLADEFNFMDSKVQLISRAEARTTYILLVCHYMALSDERKEGLVKVVVHETTEAIIDGYENMWSDFEQVFYRPGETPPHFPVKIEKAVQHGLEKAKLEAKNKLAPFLKSMRRRLKRGITSTVEYYESLYKEMESSLNHPNLTEIQREERCEKMMGLNGEVTRKIDDLKNKYHVKVTVTARAAMRLLTPVVRLHVRVSCGRNTKDIRLIWNPVTRTLDPLVCQKCGKTLRRIYFSKDPDFKPLCFNCSK